MKQIQLTIFALLLVIVNIGYTQNTAKKPTTQYYKQIKVVTKERKELAGNAKGQFITFNEKGCYDSDKSGYSVNNGFLKLEKQTAERVYYAGESYWGKAVYIFTENYGRLNIVVEESGITYVYVAAAPTANITTCALIKTSKPNTINPVVGNPVIPAVNGYYNDGSISNGSSSDINSNKITCKLCNGTGKCTTCAGYPKKTCSYCYGRGKNIYGSGSNAEYSTCAVCNGTGYTLCWCVTGNCKSCYGKGWFYK